MNLGPFKDRRVQLAAAAVAVVGLIALARRGSSGAQNAVDPATLDTSGTDSYAAMQQMLQGYSDQLQGVVDQLGQTQQPVTSNPPPPVIGPTTPPPVPRPTTKPKPKPTKKPGPKYIFAGKFTSKGAPWNSTLSGIAQHYHTSVPALLKLNPGIKNPDRIAFHQRIRYQ